MEQLVRNQKLNVSVRTVKSGEEVLFYAKDVAESLGYSNTKKAVRNHVWEEDKRTLGSVQEYLKKYHPKALILPGLGEYQDTSQKRCDAWRKGYMGGQPDLTIVTPSNGFHGFAIELKTPKGTGEVRDNQVSWLKVLNENGYWTLISNDYTKIVLDIEEYFRVDKIKKLLEEIKNLKIKCKTLKASKCKEVVIQRIGYTVGKY
ncbi:VRR-NUC domain-containing [Paramuricea clavata]|uniref:VRR-NUC domain-containing n=1 Tax=Paramuricea clavata TaxID=317549 RepID=A0A6S7INE2_PARCT|nr:VRR-NUC domain-containing [Paramuricea clavata]